MPIAKSAAPEVRSTPQVTQNPPDSISRLDIGGVPVDVYNYFGTPLNSDEKVVNKLKVIADWAKLGGGTDGDMMLRIRQLENHLGSPDGLDRRYEKLFNYCKMDLYSRELDKKKEALRRRF
jgi:hypothetical protein